MNPNVHQPASFARRLAVLCFGATTYGVFLLTFLAMIAFVEGLFLPKTIDVGRERPFWPALLVNGSILGLFGVQHTIMARIWWKRWWTRLVSPAIERSIFVLVTCTILWLLILQWRAVPDVVWHVQQPVLAAMWTALSWGGWALVLVSTFLIDHFELFGLKQVIAYFRGRRARPPEFQVRSLYRVCRHPLYVGFLTAFWATPHMTVGHLMFAGIVSLYLAVGIRIEERTLIAIHGDDYRDYRHRVPMLLPSLARRWRAVGDGAAARAS
jgi:protein-S-isoprenylcysteine O-methyltransferase Ste14